ncbi:hypothetical protein GALMADRAFT_144078 [Galerina marginata CBS 339.88]|uniref:Uncharacterized protein n=1 Tax=Galerina marginata (strain CBS 339.88) TaxID=685588 RepID=A0A067SW73_GALM3|nr:hypothetical protein GALMADRAFT_144078 [Galerina marginata CBS 339.88]
MPKLDLPKKTASGGPSTGAKPQTNDPAQSCLISPVKPTSTLTQPAKKSAHLPSTAKQKSVAQQPPILKGILLKPSSSTIGKRTGDLSRDSQNEEPLAPPSLVSAPRALVSTSPVIVEGSGSGSMSAEAEAYCSLAANLRRLRRMKDNQRWSSYARD